MKKKNNIIHAFTRKQALADGDQIEVPKELLKDARLRFPTFLTKQVYNNYVLFDDSLKGLQDETGRMYDIVYMFAYAIRTQVPTDSIITFSVFCQMTPNKKEEVKLRAEIGAYDIDNGSPAITIMLPNED